MRWQFIVAIESCIVCIEHFCESGVWFADVSMGDQIAERLGPRLKIYSIRAFYYTVNISIVTMICLVIEWLTCYFNSNC